MNKSILENLRDQIEERRKQQLKDIRDATERVEAEYAEDIRSFERLKTRYAASNNGQSIAPANGNSHASTPSENKIMGPVAAVREAVKLLPDQFEVGDIERTIIARAIFPIPLTRTAISSALNKLVGKGEVQVLKKHQGKYPGTYGTVKRNSQQTLPGVQ